MNRILITGGAGSLGRSLTKYILEQSNTDMVFVYSRDEAKHAKYYSNTRNVKCIIGDVRDKNKFKNTLIENSITHVVHAAALKRIDDMEYVPDECMKTNIIGSNNVAESITEINNYKELGTDEIRAILVSTDKACMPINAYGSSKHFAEKIFLKHGFNVVRYGNVIASRGSFIPLWDGLIKSNSEINITDELCTRYLFSLDDASKFVYHSLMDLEKLRSVTVIPKLQSYYINHVLEILYEMNDKVYNEDNINITGLRPGEKLHEDMICSSELSECYTIKKDSKISEYLKDDNCIIIRPSVWNNKDLFTYSKHLNKYNGVALNSLTDCTTNRERLQEIINKGLKCESNILHQQQT